MRSSRIKTLLMTILIACVVVIFAFPFVWMFFASFKSNLEIFKPYPILPESFDTKYYETLLSGKYGPFWPRFFNSLFISTVQTLGVLAVTVSAGYVFARFEFRGKAILFVLGLLTIVVPKQVLLIPMYEWMTLLKLTDNFASVIFPGMVSGLGLLYFTQVFKKIPNDLLEAARIEGAGECRIFFMLLPLVKPSLFTYAFLHFILSWNEHLLPMLMLSEEKMTITVALSMLLGKSMNIDYAMLMAGSVFLLMPVSVLFILMYRQFKTALADLMSV